MNTQANLSDTELEPQELPQVRWGGRLRDLRIAKQLTLEDIENELHLERKLLEAIEDEDTSNLPSPPFVRGYLRNYARMLDVSSEAIVEAYNEVKGEDTTTVIRTSHLKEANSQDRGPYYVTVGLITLLVASVLIWWATKLLSPSGQDDSVTPPAEQVGVTETPATPVISTQVIIDDANKPADEAATSNLEKVSLKFEGGDSWVEVIDATGKPLLTRTAKAGQSLTVEGQPPFKVLLGNSSAVIIDYKGKLFDHRMYETGDGIARFTVE